MSLLDDLVSYWKLDEASGATRVDSHGSNDLSDNNTVPSVSGKIGNAAQFVAANNDWLSVADNASLQVGALDWTFSAWLWINSTATGLGALSRHTGANTASTFVLRAGVSAAQAATLSTISGTSQTNLNSPAGSFTAGAWHLVVFGWDEAAKKLWIQVNAGTVVESGVVGTPNAGSRPLTIGRLSESSNNDWDGLIDEVAFWKRKLTQPEVAALYNGGAGLTYEAFLTITGTMAATETTDTAAFVGDVLVEGDLAATESADTAALTGAVIVEGDLAATEAADSAALAGTILIEGAVAATEAPDTFASTGYRPYLAVAHPGDRYRARLTGSRNSTVLPGSGNSTSFRE